MTWNLKKKPLMPTVAMQNLKGIETISPHSSNAEPERKETVSAHSGEIQNPLEL